MAGQIAKKESSEIVAYEGFEEFQGEGLLGCKVQSISLLM